MLQNVCASPHVWVSPHYAFADIAFAASCISNSGVAFTIKPQTLQRTTWLSPLSGIVGIKNRVSHLRVLTTVCTVERAHFAQVRSTCPTTLAFVLHPIRKNIGLAPSILICGRSECSWGQIAVQS